MSQDFRPRGIGAIADGAIELYRANFRTIALSSFIIVFPFALILGVIQTFYFRGILELFGSIDEALISGSNPFTELSVVSLFIYPVTYVFAFARAYFASALYNSAPAMLHGQKVGLKQFIAGGRRHLLAFVLVSVAAYLASQIGYLLLLVPGVILYVRLSLAALTTVTEDRNVDSAFRRSWTLTSGAGWRIVGFVIVVGLLTYALESAVNAPAIIRQVWDSAQNPNAVFAEISVWWKTAEGMLSAAAVSLVTPFVYLCWYGLYLDLRARRDGMDLHARALDLAKEA
jgi:hypothetical protein